MVRRFDRNDWQSWAGAERFTDGSEPFIGDVVIDGEEGVVVGGATGVDVVLGEDLEEFGLRFDDLQSPEVVEALCTLLEHSQQLYPQLLVSRRVLELLGFKCHTKSPF